MCWGGVPITKGSKSTCIAEMHALSVYYLGGIVTALVASYFSRSEVAIPHKRVCEVIWCMGWKQILQ